jgi:hypothetical protein
MTDNKEEQLKSFWFYIGDDYRSGRSIYTFTNPPKYGEEQDGDEDEEEYEEDEYNNTPEEACEIKFALPKEGQRLYIVNEFPYYKPIWHKDIDDDENTEQLYLKIFSQIHDCMPFKVSGYNSAYKEEGCYPDVSNDIFNMHDIIDKDLIKKISECEDDGYYFLFVVDCDGDEIRTNLLNPI